MNTIKKIIAWLGIIIILLLFCIMAYAMISHNGKLVLSMIVAIVFISVLFWIGLKFAKDAEKYNEALKNNNKKQDMYDISHKNTKNL